MLNTFILIVAKPNRFENIIKKLLSDPYVLFVVTVAMFLDGSNIPISVLRRIPREHSYQVCFYLAKQCRGEEFKKVLKTTDAR